MLSILKIGTNQNISISHTKSCSVVCTSKKFKVGIDIEGINRKLTNKLKNRLIKNDQLQIDPIVIWTMMESAFKCLDGKGEHFLNYNFSEHEDGFILEKNNKKVRVVNEEFNKHSISVSFIDSNLSC